MRVKPFDIVIPILKISDLERKKYEHIFQSKFDRSFKFHSYIQCETFTSKSHVHLAATYSLLFPHVIPAQAAWRPHPHGRESQAVSLLDSHCKNWQGAIQFQPFWNWSENQWVEAHNWVRKRRTLRAFKALLHVLNARGPTTRPDMMAPTSTFTLHYIHTLQATLYSGCWLQHRHYRQTPLCGRPPPFTNLFFKLFLLF